MAVQYQCKACTTRTFYVMAQDNGTIVAFCTTHNHDNELVNIPDLCAAILNVTEGDKPEDERHQLRVKLDSAGLPVRVTTPEIEGCEGFDGTVTVDSPLVDSDSTGDGGDI